MGDTPRRNYRGVDLSGRILFGEDFSGADLRGVKISLSCHQFDGATFDQDQVALFLLLLTLANIDPVYKQRVHEMIIEVIGEPRLRTLERYLQLA